MSFGFSIGDFITLTQLASRLVQDSRKACGAHDELTQEVSGLHTVLQRLKRETENPESPLNRPGDSCQDELQSLLARCKKPLKKLETILNKYNALGQAERNGRRLWLRIRFGNGEMQDLADLRAKLVYYTSALSLFLNMVSIGTIGRVEKRMEEAGGDLREIKLAVNGITAHLLAGSKAEGSVLTAYADDDKAVWKEFRRELVSEGFSSATIHKHKNTIKAYIKELASRGLLDELHSYGEDNGVTHDTSDAGEDSLPSPSCGPVQDNGTGGESPTSSPYRNPYHQSLSDSEASHHETGSSSKPEIDLTPSINYTPEVEGEHFWTMGDIPILRLLRSDSCRVARAGQTIEDVPRPILISPVRNESFRCVRCLSNILTVPTIMLLCGPRMCPACLRRLFELSILEPQYMPPRCCNDGFIPFKHVDKLFNESFQVQWEQEFEGYLRKLAYPYDVDEQLGLHMPQEFIVHGDWDPVYEVYEPVFVFIVGPYETCLSLFGWNVSFLLCTFRHWFGIIQKGLSEPRIAQWRQESLEPPHVLHGIEMLVLLKRDAVQIAGMDKVEALDVVDPVLLHLNSLNRFIDYLPQKALRGSLGPSFRVSVNRIDHWLIRAQRECPKILYDVQQLIYMIERTEAKWDPEDMVNCTSRYMSSIGNDDLRYTSHQSAPTDCELERDQVDSSAPIRSRTSDDREDFWVDSISMAKAIWESVDKLKLFHSPDERLRQLLSYYQEEMEPRCVNCIVGPPSDAKTKEQAFKMLHEWVETDFLQKVDHSEIDEDTSLVHTMERRIEEAKSLLERLQEGMSSANGPSGGTCQESTEERTK